MRIEHRGGFVFDVWLSDSALPTATIDLEELVQLQTTATYALFEFLAANVGKVIIERQLKRSGDSHE